MMKPLFTLALLFTTSLALSGCQSTLNAMSQRFMDATSTVNKVSAGDDEALLGFGYNCPGLQIVQELNTVSDFASTSTQPRADELVSRVSMSAPEMSCEYKDGTAIVDLRFKVEGTLGPQGRMKPEETATFSYPFFVAVNKETLTDTTKIMAKEVFSASFTYESDQDTHSHFESMRQVIPAKDFDEGQKYKIFIGFQLTPDQLAYNRANPAMTAAVAGIVPEVEDAPMDMGTPMMMDSDAAQ